MHTTTASKKSLSSLADIREQDGCRVISISGGQGFRNKMYQLGIHGMDELTVLRNGRSGPLVVEIGGTRLIIGRRMAERIWVMPVLHGKKRRRSE